MPAKKYIVHLSKEERIELEEVISAKVCAKALSKNNFPNYCEYR